MSGETILIVDDEPTIVEVVGLYLQREGYRVVTAADGAAALSLVEQQRPDLVVLDLMLPGLSGLEVTKRLRAGGALPIIMLTARGEEADRVVGLELGADDYLTKPFSPRELVARVKAILRRTQYQGDATQAIRRGGLVVDPERHEVTWEGEPVSLTATEFRILQFLASRAGRVLSRDDIIDAALGRETAVFDRTIDVHITSIRKKLGKGGEQIETVRGFGYKFRDRRRAED